MFMQKFDTEVAPVHDLVCLANAASFNNTFFSEELTTFAQGWRDPSDIESELEFIAPGVEVPRRFGWRKHSSKDDFLVDSDDERAPGADFKRVKQSGTQVESKTINRGLTIFIDHDEVNDVERAIQSRTTQLLRRMVRSDLVTAATLVLAGASNSGKTWGTTQDPDADLMDLVDASGDAVGFNPNRIYMGGSAWSKRVKCFRAQDNSGSHASAMMTPEQLAAWLNIEALKVSKSRYQTSASAKSKTVGAAVVAYYAEAGLSQDDPSNVKRFFSRCEDGSVRRVFRREVTGKLTAVSVERYVRTVVTSTLGLKKYTVS